MEAFEQYFDHLVQLARTQLPGNRRRVSDEEDVAQTTFTSLVLDVSNGRHLQLTNRHDLWSLLIAITKHKAADRIQSELREKRGGGQIQDESILNRRV
jgi:DNA-directed RNA polymerase specialized sigma24 family protein